MSTYLISYDLRNAESKDYAELYDEIKAYGTWARVTESTWIVVTDMSASAIRDDLMQYMDKEDRLFVLKSGVEAAWNSPRCRNDWLKKHL